MTDNTPIGDRMKRYERAFQQYLPRRSYILLRLDGRAFHSYLRAVEKPFDLTFSQDMRLVTQRLCEEIQGARFGYTQSDEVSLLLTDFDTNQTEPWVGGRMDKVISLSAALASAYLTKLRAMWGGLPTFDCRVWSMTDPVEVANYFVWRQRDAVRNSILATGQRYFSQSELNGKTTDEVQEMLYQGHGINWSNSHPAFKSGVLLAPLDGEGWASTTAPPFKAEPGNILAQLIPPLPRLDNDRRQDSGHEAEETGDAAPRP